MGGLYLSKKTMILIMINIVALLVSTYFSKSLITIIFLLWIDMIWYTLQDLETRCALFVFLLAFFVFLLGKDVLEQYGLHTIEMDFSDSINLHADIVLLLSLILLFVGYIVSSKIKVRIKTSKENFKKVNYDSSKYCTVRDVSKKIFFVTYIVNIFQVLDIVLYVVRHGYVSYYIGYSSNIPYIIGKIGDISVIAFWVFLATMPKKKDVKAPVILYMIYLFITLGTGKRFPLVAGLLTLLVYFVGRNIVNSEEKWFGKRQFKYCLVLLPILIIILFFSSFIRMGESVSVDLVKNSFTDFIYNQGASLNLIKRAKMYANLLPDGKIYTIGSTLDLLQGNLFSRLLGIISYTSGNTVERATLGNSFAHAMSYIVLGNGYLNGQGTGSSYIAEAYYDFGYLGVISINFIYGVILRKMFNFQRKGIVASALSLIMLNALLLAPRGSADAFIAELFDPTTWITIILIYGIANVVNKDSKNSFTMLII